ncbi:hypothetical protein YC2023_012609 [Brassica napus]
MAPPDRVSGRGWLISRGRVGALQVVSELVSRLTDLRGVLRPVVGRNEDVAFFESEVKHAWAGVVKRCVTYRKVIRDNVRDGTYGPRAVDGWERYTLFYWKKKKNNGLRKSKEFVDLGVVTKRPGEKPGCDEESLSEVALTNSSKSKSSSEIVVNMFLKGSLVGEINLVGATSVMNLEVLTVSIGKESVGRRKLFRWAQEEIK